MSAELGRARQIAEVDRAHDEDGDGPVSGGDGQRVTSRIASCGSAPGLLAQCRAA